MPADFLTKWIKGSKLESSLRYATNSWALASASFNPVTHPVTDHHVTVQI